MKREVNGGMKAMLYFGQYLIIKKLVTEEDVLEALKYQSKQTPSFIELACKYSYLDMKKVYEILNFQAHTDLAFEDVALQRKYITEEQMKKVIAERETLKPHLGEVLVHFGKIHEDLMAEELNNYEKIKGSYSEISTLLSRFAMFSLIGEQALDSLAYIVQKRTLKPYERVVQEGEPAESFYCIVSGSLKVTRKYSPGDARSEMEGKDVYLYRLGQNDVFGISALFEGQSRVASVENEENPSTVLSFHTDAFLEFLNEHPRASHHILLSIIQRMGHMLKMAGQELVLERVSFMDMSRTESVMGDGT